MGIDRTDYIIYGWKLPRHLRDSQENEIDFFDDKYLPYVEGWEDEDYAIVLDDDYTVFGLVIAYGGGQNEGWDFTHINLQKLDSDAVMNKYREVFGTEGYCATPYLFIFTHWH